MAVTGRKPKADRSQVRHRVKPVHEWVEVPATPYTGPRPKLPSRFRIDPEHGVKVRVEWPARTKAWWATISRMPHCRLWTAADWEFALDTAEAHARFAEGITNGTELRIREKLLGTTLDARRDLRIRYVDQEAGEQQQRPAGVLNLDDYRGL